MKRYCEKCRQMKEEKEFYLSNNTEKYPDGHINLCKKCATLLVDNWEPETYLWLLEEIDVPYIPDVWADTLTKAVASGRQITGLTVIGKYVSRMRLREWRDFRWKDTEFLQERKKAQIKQSMQANGFDAQAITQTLETGVVAMPERPTSPTPSQPEGLALGEQVEQKMVSNLTENDKIYLCTQWGKTYTADEWVRLEELYQQMLLSYDIQTAGDLNTLKLACKASLKANQLLDVNDIEGAQKAMKMYENMMKAGKWTAAQTKVDDDEFIDSVGEIINICEKDGYIERYCAPGPQDHIDRLIQDLQHYTSQLVFNETSLSTMAERAQNQLEAEEQRLATLRGYNENAEEEALFNYEADALEESDYVDFNTFLQKESEG